MDATEPFALFPLACMMGLTKGLENAFPAGGVEKPMVLPVVAEFWFF